ncbi:restriction endonuclease subunit S [Metapseudomonas otitidis]|uniref:restriction endonuclease subunit S n=1 Tax=Metapseudomonas otitidis TaxID=319939 RepID=UPI0039FD0B32
MTALLTDNLPLLAGAPNGIKKLRELILELAVRGKLVPQDPNDEPASELLNLLMKEAGSATGRGKGKKQALPGISESEQPFILPESWTWGRLGDVTEVLDSLRKPVTKQDRKPGPYPYYGASGVVDYVSAYIFDEPLVLVGEDGAKWGAGEKTAFSISGKTWVNNHAHVLRPKRSVILDDYLVISLVAQDLSQFITGMTVPKLNQARLTSIGISLPPLAEQHRIVAKVDELMALCDRLEARQADAESAHAQLVQALLDSLTQAPDAADFAQSWQRLAEHFHTLFTTESSIDALKQTLLQLAVMGKLVPQDPSDEPASELLKRIAEEKARLVKEGILRKQKSLPEVDEAEKPYALPLTWKWTRFDSVSNNRLGKMLDKAKNKGELRPYLRNTNVQWFKFELDDLKCMRFEEYELDEYRVNPGDLVICEGGEPGRCAVWQGEVEDMFIQKALHRARPWLGISPFFLQFCLKADAHSRFLDQFFTGATIKHFSGEKLAKYPVPLPPLAEQHRIVAKVDQLMALCDQLKARLSQARQVHEQLANALVEQAVA